MTETKLNPFVYEACAAANLTGPEPAFPVILAPQYAQWADDLVIAALVRAYCVTHGVREQDQTYCEIGAYHPIVTSSTYLLNQSLGMSGVLVEANESRLAELRKVRVNDIVVHAAITDSDRASVQFTISKSEGLSSLDERWVEAWTERGGGVAERVTIPAMHINRLFDEHFSKQTPLYLSIDVEGMDITLIKALDWAKHRPYIVQAEVFDLYTRGNTDDMISFMGNAGYRLVAKTGSNLIFLDAREFCRD